MGYIVIGLGSITYSGNKINESLAYRYIKKVFEESKNEYFNTKHDKCSHTFEMSGNKGIDYEDMKKIQDFLDSLIVKYDIVVNEFVESDEGFYSSNSDEVYTKYWEEDDQWLCMSCEHFTINTQNYCAGCGKIKGDSVN